MKTVVITGGTSGIGLAAAKKFLRENFNCVLVGRSEEKFLKAKTEIVDTEKIFSCDDFSRRVKFIAADVGKVSDCRKIIDESKNFFCDVNVLVNSAGIYTEGAINFVDEREFDQIFSANVKGTFFMSQAAVDELSKTHGVIVNIASDAGVRGNYFCALYSASKGAVVAFTKSLALELANIPVRVNCVAPGDILTPMTEAQIKKSGEKISDLAKIYPLGRIGNPEEVADAIFFLASDKASFITGTVLNIDGGLTA